jgi:photosystem II stability/assembly factor-like uncharacterized protein
MKKLTFLSIFFLIIISLKLFGNSSNLQNAFIENKGQWSKDAIFKTSINGMDAWVTNNGIVYDFYQIEKVKNQNKNNDYGLTAQNEIESYSTIKHGNIVKMSFPLIEFTENNTFGENNNYSNYFIGNDKNKWATDVKNYNHILNSSVEGISLKCYYDSSKFRYDIIAKPNSDLNKIVFKFEGNDKVSINSKNELVIGTKLGQIINAGLKAFQLNANEYAEYLKTGNLDKAEVVECSYSINAENEISFVINGLDKSKYLIIDPYIYSTYIGGSMDDAVYCIEVESDGTSIIQGTTYSSNFPTITGSYDTSLDSLSDIFISKLTKNGNQLLYSTYIGGKGNEGLGWGKTLIKSQNGYLFSCGTSSTNMPAFSNKYQTSNAGGYDLYIGEISSNGWLISSTYLGGSSSEGGDGTNTMISLVQEMSGNIVIASSSSSSNYPTTSGAYKTTNSVNDYTGVISILDKNLTSLLYSTYLGGTSSDYIQALKVACSGDIIVSGNTYSSNFPTTTGTFQTAFSGSSDIFVSVLNNSLNTLISSTLMGDSLGWQGTHAIDIDSKSNIYIAAQNNTQTYVTNNAYDISYNGGSSDAYIVKFSKDLKAVLYATYLGGSLWESPYDIKYYENYNSLLISGNTSSNDYPLKNADDNTNNNSYNEGFITKLNLNSNTLVYSTYIGGNSSDVIFESECFDNKIYSVGYTSSSDFYTTNGAFDQTYNNGTDGFVISLSYNSEENQAKNIKVLDKQLKSFTVNWDDGSKTKRIVFVKQTGEGFPLPSDGYTYSAYEKFGDSTQIGSTGWYCVYNGVSHPGGVTVTGLYPNTTYRVAVLEYEGYSGSEKYLTFGSKDNAINVITNNYQEVTMMHPTPTNLSLTDIYQNDDDNLVAIGWKGTTVLSKDGGESWYLPETNGLSDTYFQDMEFVGRNFGFAACWAGSNFIYKTTDGGITWFKPNNTINYYIQSIKFRNTLKGLVTCDNGYTYNTSDGGNNWNTSYIGVNKIIYSSCYLNDSTNYVVGAEGIIYRTTNSGSTWTSVSSGVTKDLRGIVFNQSTGIIVGNAGTILRTTNGGSSWSTIQTNQSYDLFKINYVSSSEIYVTGPQGFILKSTDDGATWNSKTFTSSNDLRQANNSYFYNGKGWFVGNWGQIMSTTNGGTNWTYKDTTAFYESVTALHFPSSNVGYGSVSNGVVVKTTNAGKNWTKLNTGVSNFLASVFFVSDSVGYACGNNGKIIKTTNAGSSWSSTNLPTNKTLTSIFFPSSSRGFVVADSGKIFRTINSGSSWSLLTSGTTKLLTKVKFMSDSIGIAVGDSGTVLVTLNGGSSWTLKTLNSNYYFRSCSILNQSTFLVSGNGVPLYKTTDAGANWNSIISSLGATDMEFINSSVGFIVADWGSLYKTSDGGNSWTEIHTRSYLHYQDVAIGGSYGYAVNGWGIDRFETQAVSSINKPYLILPPNGSEQLSQKINFYWNKVDEASTYQFQISASQFFNYKLVQYYPTSNSYSLSKLETNTTYYWRVRAYNSNTNKYSDWSDIWYFKTNESSDNSYCLSKGGCDEYINYVKVWNLELSSGCSQNGYYGPYGDDNLSWIQPYDPIICTKGSNDSITVKLQSYYSTDTVTCWVDWNNDFKFDNSEITYLKNSPSDTKTFKGIIYTDNNAELGNKVLRIRSIYSFADPIQPCGIFYYGETEDYNFELRDYPLIAPYIVEPLDSAKVPPHSAVIWTRMNNETGYHFQLSTDPNFGSFYINAYLSNNYYVLDSLPVNTYYYARVRSSRSGSYSNWSNIRIFKVQNSTLPSKIVKVKSLLFGLWANDKHLPGQVSLELRTGSTLLSSTVSKRISGVIDSMGYAFADFGEMSDGDYWLVVRATGYLPVADPSKISLSTSGIIYDFTTGSDKSVSGTNAMIQPGGTGPWMIRCGDFNNSRSVTATDMNNYFLPNNGKSVSSAIPAP